MDRGPGGITDTITHLAANNLKVFGAGLNITQAEAPLFVETPYSVVAVVALGYDWGDGRTASEDSAGTVPLSKASIQRGFDLAQTAGADWVVAYVHWGGNYSEISDQQRRWANEFAQAGYNLVIGHGAHSLQSIEIIGDMPVIFSLGNSVFGTPGRFSDDFSGYGLFATAELGPDGFESLVLRCIQTDNQMVNFQPQPCTQTQAQKVLKPLYTELILNQNFGILSW